MRTATIISIMLHIGVFLFAWLGVPRSQTEIVPMQVIDVEFETEVAELKPEPEPEPAPEPEVKPLPPPPAPERPQPVAAPEPEPVPEAKPEPEPIPEPAPPVVAEPVPEAVPEPKPEPPQVVQAPRPKSKPTPPRKAERPPEPKPEPEKKPKPKNDFASVLKTVSKLEKSVPKTEQKPEKTLQQQVAEALRRNQATSRPAPRIDTVLSASELDAIRRQIEGCWSLPAGARDAQNMTVEIRTLMNPDGRVRSAEIVDTARARSDSFYRSMAESALRAVLNPNCQPLRLPVEKYNEWRVMVLNFDPRGMF